MIHRFMIAMFVFILIFSILTMQKNIGFASPEELQPGNAKEVDMLKQPLNEMDGSILHAMLDKEMPGGVVLVARKGSIVKHDAYGYALKYADGDFNEVDNPVKMEKDMIFDLASISKLFTVTAAMQLYEAGKFELDDPVADHLPMFAENDKSGVTIRQLMTHTSGFTAWIPLGSMADTREEALETVLTYPIAHDPGTNYEYSDLNMITLGALIEEWSGKRLDAYVRENITEPLGMADTMYNPPESLIDRIAATAYVPGRGMVRGVVHDGNSLVLDGVAGHAGVFSSATDLAAFSQMMLNKGIYNATRILKEETVELITENHIPEFPGDDHGLGWELNQDWYMGALAEPSTIGHTGFTGTSVVVSPTKESITILLTNRVHPIDVTPSTNPIRKAMAGKTADAMNAWNANTIKTLVEDYEEKEELDEKAAKKLKVHLTAVGQYEKTKADEKVIKHLEGFKILLDHQQEKNMINQEAYQTLQRDTDYLIEKWHYPNEDPPYEKKAVIGILPLEMELTPGEETELSIHGLDVNGGALDIDQRQVEWKIEGDIGTIEDGVFTASKQGEGKVTATYNGLSNDREIIVANNIINNIRYGVHAGYTRTVFDLNKNTAFDMQETEGKLILSVPYAEADSKLGDSGTMEIKNSPVLSAVDYHVEGDVFVAEFQLKDEVVSYETPKFSNRIVVDVAH